MPVIDSKKSFVIFIVVVSHSWHSVIWFPVIFSFGWT